MYSHEQTDWPEFRWDAGKLTSLLADVRHSQGRLLGRMGQLGFRLREEATLRTLTADVVKTSEIEGEILDAETVRSSIARRLGMEIGALRPVDRGVEGIVEILLDATRNFSAPLTRSRLFGWHAALFPAGHSGLRRIAVGAWRSRASGAMQVVSGPVGRELVHFEAPAYRRLKGEMRRFLKWCDSPPETDGVLKSAVAHFWFVTIHPFEDGNGRIARAIADLMLARSENTSQRFYSMSAQIQQDRSSYYDALERSQKETLDLTKWIDWYLNCLRRAIGASEKMLENILAKDSFWRKQAGQSINERQRKVINRLLDRFEGKLTSSKWAKLAKCSQDTALRDIDGLIGLGILAKEQPGGRSTNYVLRIPSASANPAE